MVVKSITASKSKIHLGIIRGSVYSYCEDGMKFHDGNNVVL